VLPPNYVFTSDRLLFGYNIFIDWSDEMKSPNIEVALMLLIHMHALGSILGFLPKLTLHFAKIYA